MSEGNYFGRNQYVLFNECFIDLHEATKLLNLLKIVSTLTTNCWKQLFWEGDEGLELHPQSPPPEYPAVAL